MDDRECTRAKHGSRLLAGGRRSRVDLEGDVVPVENSVILRGSFEGRGSSGVDRLPLCAAEVLLETQVDFGRVIGELGRDDSRDVGKEAHLRRVERSEEAGGLGGDVREALHIAADWDVGRESRAPLSVNDDLGDCVDGGDLCLERIGT